MVSDENVNTLPEQQENENTKNKTLYDRKIFKEFLENENCTLARKYGNYVLVSTNLIGNLSNDNGDGNENVTELNILFDAQKQ